MFYRSGTPKKVGYAAQLWNTISQYLTRLSMSGGALIYVAYRRSQADMLTRGLYKLVYTP